MESILCARQVIADIHALMERGDSASATNAFLLEQLLHSRAELIKIVAERAAIIESLRLTMKTSAQRADAILTAGRIPATYDSPSQPSAAVSPAA